MFSDTLSVLTLDCIVLVGVVRGPVLTFSIFSCICTHVRCHTARSFLTQDATLEDSSLIHVATP